MIITDLYSKKRVENTEHCNNSKTLRTEAREGTLPRDNSCEVRTSRAAASYRKDSWNETL